MKAAAVTKRWNRLNLSDPVKISRYGLMRMRYAAAVREGEISRKYFSCAH